MFVCQPTLNFKESKKDKDTKYVISWKSKGIYTSKLTPLSTAFLHNVRLFGYKIGIQFNKSVLVVEQNNYATKIVNAYIVYNLDDWPKFLLNNV